MEPVHVFRCDRHLGPAPGASVVPHCCAPRARHRRRPANWPNCYLESSHGAVDSYSKAAHGTHQPVAGTTRRHPRCLAAPRGLCTALRRQATRGAWASTNSCAAATLSAPTSAGARPALERSAARRHEDAAPSIEKVLQWAWTDIAGCSPGQPVLQHRAHAALPTLPVTAFQQNPSLVGATRRLEAAVIDPGGDLPISLGAGAAPGRHAGKAIWPSTPRAHRPRRRNG